MNFKMEKRFIWISLIVFIFSCSSRRTNTDIKSKENRSKIEQNIKGETNVHIKKTEVENDRKEVSKLSLSIKNNPDTSPNSEYHKNSTDCLKTRNITYRDKEGNEAVIPINENSEINLDTEKTEETKLKQISEELSEQSKINEQLKKENLELKKSKIKSSERSGISFASVLWIIVCSVIGGVIAWSLIKKFIPKWFNCIVKRLNKKR